MRTVIGTLLTAMQAVYNTPYIHLLFTSADGLTTHDYSSNLEGRRILSIDHTEQAYVSPAAIILNNYDHSIPNLKGYWTEIGYGYVTGTGNEYIGDGANGGTEASPRLWVKSQQDVSDGRGRRVCVLEFEGMWEKLEETLLRLGTNANLQYKQYTLTSIYAIISAILAEALPVMHLDTQVEDDNILDTLQPNFDINLQQVFESAGAVIYRLINMTKSYLRAKATLGFEVKFPQESDSINITYYSDAVPYFFEYSERRNVLVPSHALAFANEGEDGLWTNIITGEYEDTEESDIYADTYVLALAGDLANETDADNRARAIIDRAKMELLEGRMTAPHDCRLELYDRVQVMDNR